METIVAAIITGVLTGGISLAGIVMANGKNMAVLQEQVVGLRRDVTDIKQDFEKTNQVKERVSSLEAAVAVHEQRHDAAEARIKRLEGAA